MANAIANATANAMANAVTDHGTVAGRPKATGYLHLDALWKPFGCLFHDFLIPFGSLLAPFGRVGRPFLDPGTTPGLFRVRGAKRYEKVTLWLNFGGSRGAQFESILLLLITFERLVFCCFFGRLFFSQFAIPGPIWDTIGDAF